MLFYLERMGEQLAGLATAQGVDDGTDLFADGLLGFPKLISNHGSDLRL